MGKKTTGSATSTWKGPPSSVRPDVSHLLSLEQQLCRDRTYVRLIPPLGPDTRYLLTSPSRKRSFYDVTRCVEWPPLAQLKGRPRLLRSVLYEERLRDIMHRITRMTYSRRAKHPELLRPQDMYTCCPRKGF